MILHDEKEQFYQELSQKIGNGERFSKEFIAFLSTKREEEQGNNSSGFYELCSKFSDISLNAPKYADPKTCDVQASFQFKDIDIAKEAFKQYVAENELNDYEGILEVIRVMHPFAVAWNDSRQKTAVVQPKNYQWDSPFYGKYHNFCELPEDIWGKISSELLKELNH